MQSCSIFDFIGIEDEPREQLKFIATNKHITPIGGNEIVIIDEFDKAILKYSKREIFEKQGRLISIRPKTLALFLASEWFETCNSERLENVINDIQAHSNAKLLTESLCKQIQYLGYNESAKSLFDKLLAANGPFDNAKVLNTELGSRLFRSFVEVNPIAVADNLYRLLGSMTIEQLKTIEEGRRNLVWTLEKLCFNKDTFEQGARLMMSFAVAENETWGNNSTAEFLHLFKILLPGTQANLKERLDIIKWGLSKENEYRKLSIKAIGSALESQNFNYFCGAEKQGTKRLEHYNPSNKEIREYWSSVLELLKLEVLSQSDDNDLCFGILEQKLRGLIRAGASDLILPIIEDVISFKNNDWNKMFDSLYSVLDYDTDFINEEIKNRILQNINSLKKQDFVFRFNEIRKRRGRGSLKKSFEEDIKETQTAYGNLAIEFVNKEYCSKTILKALYLDKESFSTPFGFTIADKTKNDFNHTKLFIDNSIEILNEISDQFNPSILIEYSRGLNEVGASYLIEKLFENADLSNLLFPILAVQNVDLEDLSKLFSLVEDNPTFVGNFKTFFNHYPITPDSDKKIALLLQKLKGYGTLGVSTAFSIVSSILLFNRDIKLYPNVLNFTERTIKEICFSDSKELLTDNLFQAIMALLNESNRPELATHVNREIIKIANDLSTSFSYNYKYEQLYAVLLEKYFDIIWTDLSRALLSEGNTYMIYYNFKYLLGSTVGDRLKSIGLLFADTAFALTFNNNQTNCIVVL